MEAAFFRRRWADGGFSVELSGAKTQFEFIAITVSEKVSPNRMDLDRRGRVVSQDGSLNKLRFVESLGCQRHFLKLTPTTESKNRAVRWDLFGGCLVQR